MGGLKEKCLAAFRSGVQTVAIPFQNQKDLEEIPRPLRNKLNFILARNMSDVLAVAFDDKAGGAPAKEPGSGTAARARKQARRSRPKSGGDRTVPANA